MCDSDKQHLSSDPRIILNVGGIRYETYRSTLLAYPQTLLGTMFQPRNDSLLQPTNNSLHNHKNEYFFDRNGYAFRYILEFYRTGKILWPKSTNPLRASVSQNPLKPSVTSSMTVDNDKMDCSVHQYTIPTATDTLAKIMPVSLHELQRELEFFQIPSSLSLSSPASQSSISYNIAAQILDDFIYILESLICESIESFSQKITIKFYEDFRPVEVFMARYRRDDALKGFEGCGWEILDLFEQKISKRLKLMFPGLITYVGYVNSNGSVSSGYGNNLSFTLGNTFPQNYNGKKDVKAKVYRLCSFFDPREVLANTLSFEDISISGINHNSGGGSYSNDNINVSPKKL
ncbi:9043_t:CDS:2 [Cetraspora pellucida]|uniref:9043_t:CDS:1 n=1 Tax=Cetraspora pellucida TaxID=1433469 RepID=A0ACA9LX33_9GLOM|nr:9043_t:CDS:2 [Cetraspora pellucida]